MKKTYELNLLRKRFELDFRVLFYWKVGVLVCRGQADYATEKVVKDRFANDRNQRVKACKRNGLTLSIS